MSVTTGSFKTIGLAGLVAGTFDAIAAIVVYKANPIRMFQFIASGAFGKEAFSGGMTMAFWGLFFHFVIAFSWASFFFLIYPRVDMLSKNRIVSGLAYGIFIWVIMNLVILPMTQIPQGPFNFKGALIGSTILMLMVGLPISWITYRHYSGK